MGKNDDRLIRDAREVARWLLRKQRPQRWLHTRGVANRAAEVSATVRKSDRGLLIAAAWLHDIGYSPLIRETGFHPLDGGLYLQDHGWDQRVAALVAHHSGARFVPVERGLRPLLADFQFEESHVADALTYANQTVSPSGKRMTVQQRIAEAIQRHGPDSPNAQARIDREPYLVAVAARVESRLSKVNRK